MYKSLCFGCRLKNGRPVHAVQIARVRNSPPRLTTFECESVILVKSRYGCNHFRGLKNFQAHVQSLLVVWGTHNLVTQ